LLIASATSAAAQPRDLWREEHDMPNALVNGRFGSTGFDARCHRGLDQCRNSDQGHVPRSRGREGRQRTESALRQSWCTRGEFVEAKHDFCSGKADTDET
jgi:hypothetical protein